MSVPLSSYEHEVVATLNRASVTEIHQQNTSY